MRHKPTLARRQKGDIQQIIYRSSYSLNGPNKRDGAVSLTLTCLHFEGSAALVGLGFDEGAIVQAA